MVEHVTNFIDCTLLWDTATKVSPSRTQLEVWQSPRFLASTTIFSEWVQATGTQSNRTMRLEQEPGIALSSLPVKFATPNTTVVHPPVASMWRSSEITNSPLTVFYGPSSRLRDILILSQTLAPRTSLCPRARLLASIYKREQESFGGPSYLATLTVTLSLSLRVTTIKLLPSAL